MRTFIIGDVHGHHDRLTSLLKKAGLISLVGHKRTDDTRIIQVGDLGNFSIDSRKNDERCYALAQWYDIEVLWGNHDRAAVDLRSTFVGYAVPDTETKSLMRAAKPQFAAYSFGHIITHAGVHPRQVPYALLHKPAQALAHYLDCCSGEEPIITDISTKRGGTAACGGILWRDASEELFNIPQIFGHTRSDSIREYNDGAGICIDIAEKTGHELAGIFLSDDPVWNRRVVAVGDNPREHEDRDMWVIK